MQQMSTMDTRSGEGENTPRYAPAGREGGVGGEGTRGGGGGGEEEGSANSRDSAASRHDSSHSRFSRPCRGRNARISASEACTWKRDLQP